MGKIPGIPGNPMIGRKPANYRELPEDRVRAALEQCGGNVARTAELLGVSIRTVRRKVDDYGIDLTGYRTDEENARMDHQYRNCEPRGRHPAGS